MIYPSKKIYDGHWVHKRRHGYGVMRKQGKRPIEGNWCNNMLLKDGEENLGDNIYNLKEDYGEEECKESEMVDDSNYSFADEEFLTEYEAIKRNMK
jgi:hypothetical protein